jgi:hypothetical protein
MNSFGRETRGCTWIRGDIFITFIENERIGEQEK